jgi:hypothetical protein
MFVMKYIKILLSFLVVVCPLFAAQRQQLFFIARSKNANIVRYDALLDSNGKLMPARPIDAYWVLLAKDGSREELGALDKRAYGYKCTADKNSSGFQLIVQSFASRPIKVYQSGSIARAEIIINGAPAYLEKIFISASNGFIPKVYSIELYGKDIKLGTPVYEKIKI